MKCKCILYIAMSMDGFIAGENDNLDFLNPYQMDGEDYGYKNFTDSVSHVLVGRKTFEVVQGMGFPYHPDKIVYVITNSTIHSKNKNIIFYNGDLASLINEIQSSSKMNIYCDGGAVLAKFLIANELIDEIILSIIPIALKSGTELFKNGETPVRFKQHKQINYPNGVIQKHYRDIGKITE